MNSFVLKSWKMNDLFRKLYYGIDQWLSTLNKRKISEPWIIRVWHFGSFVFLSLNGWEQIGYVISPWQVESFFWLWWWLRLLYHICGYDFLLIILSFSKIGKCLCINNLWLESFVMVERFSGFTGHWDRLFKSLHLFNLKGGQKKYFYESFGIKNNFNGLFFPSEYFLE